MKKGFTLFILISSLCFVKYDVLAQQQKQYYAVLIGISNYNQSNAQLQYADDDATNMYQKLLAMNVPSTNIALLTNEQATNDNIVASLKKQFSKANQKDEVIFFFSGHGGNGYFATYDLPNVLYHSQVKTVFKSCKASTKLVFVDACYSGTLKDIPTAVKGDSSNNSLKDFTTNKQIIVFASSRSNQTSIENSQHHNGFFTYYLLRALGGYADENNDRVVTFKELYSYVATNVKRDSKGTQNPNMFGSFKPDASFFKLKSK